jgi:hypothetical protein
MPAFPVIRQHIFDRISEQGGEPREQSRFLFSIINMQKLHLLA